MFLAFDLMIHNINFNKIACIDWSKVFIMAKHVFYDLSYAQGQGFMTIVKDLL